MTQGRISPSALAREAFSRRPPPHSNSQEGGRSHCASCWASSRRGATCDLHTQRAASGPGLGWRLPARASSCGSEGVGVSGVQGLRGSGEQRQPPPPPDTHLLLHLPVMVRYLLLHFSTGSWRAQPLVWDSRCNCGSVSTSAEEGGRGQGPSSFLGWSGPSLCHL